MSPCDPFSVSLARVGGGAFDLGSFDIDDGDGQGIDVQMSLAYTDASGTHAVPVFDTDTSAGFQTKLLGLTGLFSFVFTGNYAFQIDNVNLAASTTAVTPIPPTMGLFAGALAGLGFVGWRRKQSA